MQRLTLIIACAWIATGCEAQGIGNLADVRIIDRDSGTVLTPYFHHGEYWVAGHPGARYAIEVHNRLGERVLAVTSVDGINILNGASAGWDQTGYVFGPWSRYQLTGWRKSDAEVAAFTFTDLGSSYAARTGRPSNVGVIGVAVFREASAPPVYAPPISPPSPPIANRGESIERMAPMASMPSQAMRAPLPQLGTGHGEREYSYVNQTQFTRAQAQPDEVIQIRYDSQSNLVAMGIMPRPWSGPVHPEPFPGSRGQGYVPDPPG